MWPSGLNNLAALLEDQGRWPEAVALYAEAKPIMTGAHGGGEPERGGLGKAVLAQNTGDLRAYARALYRAGASDAANRAEGFELAQWALQNDAADALSAMAARFAKGGQELGEARARAAGFAWARARPPIAASMRRRARRTPRLRKRRAPPSRRSRPSLRRSRRAAPRLPRLCRAGQSEAALARGRASAARRRRSPRAVSRSLADRQGSRRDDCLRAHQKRGALDEHSLGHAAPCESV